MTVLSTALRSSWLVFGLLVGVASTWWGVPAHGAQPAEVSSVSLQVSPRNVAAASWNTLTFTFTARSEGIANGTFVVSIPKGWATPSTSQSDAGRVIASAGVVTVSGRSIAVARADVTRGSALVVTYGGGPTGVTAPTEPGRYRFNASMASPSDIPVPTINRPPTVEGTRPEAPLSDYDKSGIWRTAAVSPERHRACEPSQHPRSQPVQSGSATGRRPD